MDLALQFSRRLSSAIGQKRFDLWFAEQVAFKVLTANDIQKQSADDDAKERLAGGSSQSAAGCQSDGSGRIGQSAIQLESNSSFVLTRIQHQFHHTLKSVACSFEPALGLCYAEAFQDEAFQDSPPAGYAADQHMADAKLSSEQLHADSGHDNSLANNLVRMDKGTSDVITSDDSLLSLPSQTLLQAGKQGNSPSSPCSPPRNSAGLVEGAKPSGLTSNDGLEPGQRKSKGRRGAMDFHFCDQNQLAQVAVKSIAAGPCDISPLVFHGPTGSGKSTLLKMIQRLARRRQAQRSVLMTAEQFTASFLGALNGRGLTMFRRNFRDLDLLIVEDIQFFDGKKATTSEFHHTVDHLVAHGKQIVLSCDRKPIEMDFLNPELVARLQAGMLCPLRYASLDARVQILRNMCRIRDYSFPDSVLALIADRIPHDGRQLSGAINRLQMASAGRKTKWTPQQAESILADLIDGNEFRVSLKQIEKTVCELSDVSVSDIRSAKRSRKIVAARMLAMWLGRKFTRAALSEIGDHFGGRSHSTVIAATRKMDQLQAENGKLTIDGGQYQFNDLVDEVHRQLKAG